jgi:hypothetical protein
MRSDMAKVIVERPRFGSWMRGKGKGARRRLQAVGLDGFRREGIKRPYAGNAKCLNEHLGPLNRYLNSQVGRPWDKVFSEICAHVRRDSAVQDHVRDHVLDYVTVNVVLIAGVPCHAGGGRFGRQLYGVPIRGGHTHQRFYVCPRTGLLRRVPQDDTKRRRQARRKAVTPQTPAIPLDKTRQLHLLDGSWCEVTLRPFDAELPLSPAADVLSGNRLTPGQARERYGVLAYAVRVRRLGRDELRHLPIPIDLLRGRRGLPEVVR